MRMCIALVLAREIPTDNDVVRWYHMFASVSLPSRQGIVDRRDPYHRLHGDPYNCFAAEIAW